MFTLNDTPGILLKALSAFTNNEINLTRILSKPSKIFTGTKSIEFYADFYGTKNDSNV